MSMIRNFVVYRFGIAAAIVVLISASVFAQETDDEAPDSDSSEEIEEITVVARKPGDRRQVDAEYEDPVRAKLLKDFYEMQEDEEEFEWRKSAAEENPSRISWGYDPKEEYRMRNEMDLQELPSERTKPATLFRFDF
jgi:hypothetical protein